MIYFHFHLNRIFLMKKLKAALKNRQPFFVDLNLKNILLQNGHLFHRLKVVSFHLIDVDTTG